MHIKSITVAKAESLWDGLWAQIGGGSFEVWFADWVERKGKDSVPE